MTAARIFSVVALCCLFTIVMTVAAHAQVLEPGVIRVHVSNAEGARAIADAEVRLTLDSGSTSAFTDSEGNVVFRDAVPQIYSVRVQRNGFQTSDVVEFELLTGRDVHVTVVLVPKLTVIGHTQAKPAVTVTSIELSTDSAERRVSASLLDALSKIAGVTVADGAYGSNFSNSVSLNGQDSSATAYSVNGASLNGPSNVNLAQDLFTGASVAFTPTLGYLGGMIDYRTLRPTQTPQVGAGTSLGSYGASASGATFTGSIGAIGVAVQHRGRGIDSFLTGHDFLDQSGSTNYHVGGISRSADSVGLRYSAGHRLTLDFTDLQAQERSAVICARFLAALPCGIGPGNDTSASYKSRILEAVSWIGDTQLALTVTSALSNNGLDESRRLLYGRPNPYVSSSWTRNTGTTLTYLASVGKHSVRVDERLFRTTAAYESTLNGNLNGTLTYGDRENTTSFQDQYRISRKLAVTASIDSTSSTQSGPATQVGETTRWEPSKHDVLEATFVGGHSQPPIGITRTLADPGSAIFDCFNGSSLVSGPSDEPGRQSVRGFSATWNHKWNLSSVRVQAGDYVSDGGLRELLVPLASRLDGQSALTSYVGALQQYWRDPHACASAAFQPALAYVDAFVVSPKQRAKNLNVSGRLVLGRNVVAIPSFALNDVRFTSLTPQLLGPGSFYQAGVQIPNVAYASGSFTVDALMRGGIEALLNVQMAGANNANNLPGYFTLNAGVNVRTHVGTITAVISNIQNKDSGLFTMFQNINARPLHGGGAIAFPTTPLAPRQWTVTFTPKITLQAPRRAMSHPGAKH